MVGIAELREQNAKRWLVARPIRDFSEAAKKLVAPIARARYVAVSQRTNVPWFFIAVVHYREAGQRWDTQLGQGDPLDRVSVHVPKGRGPFQSWEDGAVDALVNCAPYAAKNTDWSIGGLLTELEEYNGLGYAARGVPSPYVWSGTDVYHSGKYVRDGVYDPNVIDAQLGCAGLLLAMCILDKSVSDAIGKKAAPVKPPIPTVAMPSLGARIGALIASILSAFRRKP